VLILLSLAYLIQRSELASNKPLFENYEYAVTVLFVAHASDTLYRQKQGGKAGHSNHFVVAVKDVPFIIKKLDEKGRMCLHAKGGTFCHSITMVLPVLLSLSILCTIPSAVCEAHCTK
jgi:hypothetical protein